MELPDYIAVDALAKAFKVDMGALKVLNPALRPPIWSGSRLVPRGYALRLARHPVRGARSRPRGRACRRRSATSRSATTAP